MANLYLPVTAKGEGVYNYNPKAAWFVPLSRFLLVASVFEAYRELQKYLPQYRQRYLQTPEFQAAAEVMADLSDWAIEHGYYDWTSLRQKYPAIQASDPKAFLENYRQNLPEVVYQRYREGQVIPEKWLVVQTEPLPPFKPGPVPNPEKMARATQFQLILRRLMEVAGYDSLILQQGGPSFHQTEIWTKSPQTLQTGLQWRGQTKRMIGSFLYLPIDGYVMFPSLNLRAKAGGYNLRILANRGWTEFLRVSFKQRELLPEEINASDEDGRSALFFATPFRDTYQLLVDHGANENLRDHSGFTPKSYLREQHWQKEYPQLLQVEGQQVLNFFQVFTSLKVLGEGSFGRVELMEDPSGAQYAVKFEEATGEMTPEDQILPQLSKYPNCHPDLICLHNTYYQGKDRVIIYEYLNGPNLTRVRTRFLDNPRLIYPLAQWIISLTRWLHDQGIAHLDIADRNIILMPDGRYKLIDFGLACKVGECNDQYLEDLGLMEEKPEGGYDYYGRDVEMVGALILRLWGPHPSNDPLTLLLRQMTTRQVTIQQAENQLQENLHLFVPPYSSQLQYQGEYLVNFDLVFKRTGIAGQYLGPNGEYYQVERLPLNSFSRQQRQGLLRLMNIWYPECNRQYPCLLDSFLTEKEVIHVYVRQSNKRMRKPYASSFLAGLVALMKEFHQMNLTLGTIAINAEGQIMDLSEVMDVSTEDSFVRMKRKAEDVLRLGECFNVEETPIVADLLLPNWSQRATLEEIQIAMGWPTGTFRDSFQLNAQGEVTNFLQVFSQYYVINGNGKFSCWMTPDYTTYLLKTEMANAPVDPLWNLSRSPDGFPGLLSIRDTFQTPGGIKYTVYDYAYGSEVYSPAYYREDLPSFYRLARWLIDLARRLNQAGQTIGPLELKNMLKGYQGQFTLLDYRGSPNPKANDRVAIRQFLSQLLGQPFPYLDQGYGAALTALTALTALPE